MLGRDWEYFSNAKTVKFIDQALLLVGIDFVYCEK
jgi:hypothetical protein